MARRWSGRRRPGGLRLTRCCRLARRSAPARRSGVSNRASRAATIARRWRRKSSQAQGALEGARAELTRAERLLAERAVPARRVEDAQRALAAAEARLRAAEARLAQRDETLRSGGGARTGNAFALRAPISRTSRRGIGDARRLVRRRARRCSRSCGPIAWSCGRRCRPRDVAATRGVTELAFEIPGRADPIVAPAASHARRRHHRSGDARVAGAVRDRQSTRRNCWSGRAAPPSSTSATRLRLPAVPKAAVLLEAGRPYVFVQVGGERFARRYVEIATRDGDLVGIKSGLKPGDRVVMRGAYEVQLASAAKGLPAEGHVH